MWGRYYPGMQIETVGAARYELGEGPLWDVARQCLWFVDIMRGHVHQLDPVTGAGRVFDIGQPVGAVACAERGDLVCAVRDGFVRLNVETGTVMTLALVEADNPRNRMNDGYVDARGRFWAGTMSMHHEREQGALYRLDPDGIVTQHLTGVTTSNGIDWNGDSTLMYFIDTGLPYIDIFDFDLERGTLANRRHFVKIDPAEGKPDGLIVDDEDHVWVALWRGGQIRRYAPDGSCVLTVRLPSPLTTKPAFGGRDVTELYVTSAFIDLSSEERAASPLAGSLFHLTPGVRGRAPRLLR